MPEKKKAVTMTRVTSHFAQTSTWPTNSPQVGRVMMRTTNLHPLPKLNQSNAMTMSSKKPKGKSAYYSRHPKWSQNWLISVELVLLCMFQTISLMGNCSWLS